MHTRLIINPTSGLADKPNLSTEIVDALQTQGIQAELSVTTPDEDGEGLAAEAAKAGAELAIASLTFNF